MQTMYRLPLIDLKIIPIGSNQSETYRHLLGLAMRNNRDPVVVDVSSLPTTMIRLSPAAKAQLDAIAIRCGLDYKAAFAGLCTVGAELMTAQMRKQAGLVKQLASSVISEFAHKSEGQRRYYEQIMTGLLDNRIVFAEGSTGIGKSRAMAAAAIAQAKAKKTPVVMAAPTVAVMRHLYDELRKLDTSGIEFTILPGASEFVDDVALDAYLQAAEFDPGITIDESVRMWIAEGAKPIDSDSPIAHAIGPNAAWLMDDFRQIATDMPVDDFILRRDVGDAMGEARPLLAQMRDSAKNRAGIILCTHAMLAIGQRTQWRAMPEPCVLFIDEAHQFEQSVAAVNSDQMSLYSLRAGIANLCRTTQASKTSAIGKALSEARQLTVALQAMSDEGQKLCVSDNAQIGGADRDDLVKRLTTMSAHLASKKLSDLKGLTHYRNAVQSILAAFASGGKTYNRVDLDFSPDKRYPSLYCGPARVDLQLRNIWNTAKGGAVLASATLYVIDATGNSKCDYLRGILAIDFNRLHTPSPIVDPVIYKLPTLFLPSPSRSATLIPPGKSTSSSSEDWYMALARAIHEITHSASGGTLVLLTAYRDVAFLTDQLVATGVAAERIIAQQPNQRFNETERRFRLAHSQGIRPVLLGLGAAWTGIDLKDAAATDEQDLLLTDLVLARLPIGLNRNNSMTARIERMGMHPVINETLLTLKQGLGRLIRRPNVLHRRLWVLDGRLDSSFRWVGMEGLAASARRLLREYQHRKTF
jgi:Rad3-related DNA helicase